MLQDTALGGAALAHDRQADLRDLALAARSERAATRHREPRPLLLRPANQPSILVTPRPAQLRRMWAPVAGS